MTRNQLLEFGPIGDPYPQDRDRRRYDPISAAIGIGGSLIGGLIGSNGAKSAGKTLANAGNTANQQIQDVTKTQQGFVSGATQIGQGGIDAGKNQANDILYGVNQNEQANLNPYLTAGKAGINAFSNAIAPGGSLTTQFQAPTEAQAMATPGLEFQMDQGNQAIARSAAASGSLASGGTGKALSQYSQGLASTYYQNAYNNALQSFQTNRNNQFQDLSTMAGIGLTSTGMSDAAAQNYGNIASGNTMSAASQVANMGLSGAEFNANLGLQGTQAGLNYYMQGQGGLASGQAASANAWTGALNGVGQVAGQQYAMSQGLNPYGGGYGMPGGGGYGGGGYGMPTTLPNGTLQYPSVSGTYAGPGVTPNMSGPSLFGPQVQVPQGSGALGTGYPMTPNGNVPVVSSVGPTPGAPAGGGNPFFNPGFYNPNMNYSNYSSPAGY